MTFKFFLGTITYRLVYVSKVGMEDRDKTFVNKSPGMKYRQMSCIGSGTVYV